MTDGTTWIQRRVGILEDVLHRRANPGKLLPTDSYGVVDVQGTWRPPFGARDLLVSGSLQNLLNKHYATFVGVPNLGRLFLTKLTYTF